MPAIFGHNNIFLFFLSSIRLSFKWNCCTLFLCRWLSQCSCFVSKINFKTDRNNVNSNNNAFALKVFFLEEMYINFMKISELKRHVSFRISYSYFFFFLLLSFCAAAIFLFISFYTIKYVVLAVVVIVTLVYSCFPWIFAICFAWV